ncbi:MAG TPA: amino acid ABC transporter substrate-binding protein [Acetobacteraceae bacterium]|nr:amino acid ABC transporter substrate-binding protein [Acetobacteraceae bacterium]
MITAQRRWPRAVEFAAMLLLAVACLPTVAFAGALDRIRQGNIIRIAYRADAPPFSYKTSNDEPAGFMVDLCQAVVRRLAQQLNQPSLNISYVTVTAVDRFAAIQQNKADLLCEPTSSTLSRRKLVDFSVMTFIDGASLLITPDGPHNLQELAGRTIGVLGGTTTEQELNKSLSSAGITATIIPAKTHAEGLAMLDDGKTSAYFADRSILLALIANSKAPGNLRLSDAYLTVESYALALPHGDDDFRLEVDRALSHIYGSGEITTILEHTFGKNFQPGTMLQMVYLLSGLPD